MSKTHRLTTAWRSGRSSEARAASAFAWPDGLEGLEADDAPTQREKVMQELSITYDGLGYVHGHMRFDLLTEAIAYARSLLIAPWPTGCLSRSLPAVSAARNPETRPENPA